MGEVIITDYTKRLKPWFALVRLRLIFFKIKNYLKRLEKRGLLLSTTHIRKEF